jgi:glucose-1-phosphate thymidylyltransferase
VVAHALLIGENLLGSASAALNSEDILIYGNDITASMRRAASSDSGAMLFAYRFVDLERYGVANYEVDAQGRARGTPH